MIIVLIICFLNNILWCAKHVTFMLYLCACAQLLQSDSLQPSGP